MAALLLRAGGGLGELCEDAAAAERLAYAEGRTAMNVASERGLGATARAGDDGFGGAEGGRVPPRQPTEAKWLRALEKFATRTKSQRCEHT